MAGPTARTNTRSASIASSSPPTATWCWPSTIAAAPAAATRIQKAIFADWGNLEVVDLLGAVDEAVRQGIADPNRLGLGGWSYGGISTNATIATDTRFKAAVSGAGGAMQYSMYGVDQYIIQWDQEIGPPWKSRAIWDKMSYPFFHADRIKTPTLFLGGEKDFNVPIAGGEQMYQALKSLGVDTELVIYPGQFHGLTIPSYERDRLQRYLNWFNKYSARHQRQRQRSHGDAAEAQRHRESFYRFFLCVSASLWPLRAGKDALL